jgi:outer membrane protein W
MKKIILTIILFSSLSTYSQFYIKPNIGFSFSNSGERIELTPFIGTNIQAYPSPVYINFAQGVNLGLAFGYDINENLAFELAVNGIMNSKRDNQDPFHILNRIPDNNYMMEITPSVLFKLPIDKFTPYIKIGWEFLQVFNFEKNEIYSYYDENKAESKGAYAKLDDGIDWGIKLGIGCEYLLWENFSFFSEITHLNILFENSLTKSEVKATTERVSIGEFTEYSNTKVEEVGSYREEVEISNIAIQFGAKWGF